jgi:hypothetical protein
MLTKVDIRGGHFEFRQRISLGRILTSGEPERDIYENCMLCLHPKNAIVWETEHVDYFHEIVDAIREWMDKERVYLHYDPTPEELAAGIRNLSENIGEFGTVKSLAKAFHTDPDTILDWEYGKVFNILYADLEEHKYSVRYHKQLEASFKRKGARR